jgi:hypothetical protein
MFFLYEIPLRRIAVENTGYNRNIMGRDIKFENKKLRGIFFESKEFRWSLLYPVQHSTKGVLYYFVHHLHFNSYGNLKNARLRTNLTCVNPFSACTRVQNDVAKMRVHGHTGYGEFPSSSNIHELYRQTR